MKLTIYGSDVNIILESDARITSFESGSSMRSGLFFNDRSSIAYNFYHTFRNLMIAFKKYAAFVAKTILSRAEGWQIRKRKSRLFLIIFPNPSALDRVPCRFCSFYHMLHNSYHLDMILFSEIGNHRWLPVR